MPDMEYYTVDAFAVNAFEGNPAAVVLLDKFLDNDLLQKTASELNQLTAFVVPKTGAASNHLSEYNEYDICWYSPHAEIELCGHGSLASAHVRFVHKLNKQQPSKPIQFTTHESVDRNAVAQGLGITPAEITQIARGTWGLLIEITGAITLIDRIIPNLQVIATLPTRAMVVTTTTGASNFRGGNYHFLSRMFAPRIGISKDPVCGSSHCLLAPYWADRLGTTSLRAFSVKSPWRRTLCRASA
ncbi:hypothetical protein BASA62_007564 [Batrachochytrium salamandrivorans]|nr:hypothetical protein BASA62_007564 [Batrachochytrium salamandrivorans]